MDGSDYEVLRALEGGVPGLNGADLFMSSEGILYGTTRHTGSIFKMDEHGSGYARIWIWTGLPDPVGFRGGLWEGPDGKLYGTCGLGHRNRTPLKSQ